MVIFREETCVLLWLYQLLRNRLLGNRLLGRDFVYGFNGAINIDNDRSPDSLRALAFDLANPNLLLGLVFEGSSGPARTEEKGLGGLFGAERAEGVGVGV